MPKRIILLALITIAVAAFAAWKISSGSPGRSSDELRLSGNVDIREVTLGFRAFGRVAEVVLHEGDAVAKDQVLARLDPEPFQREIEEAQAQVAAAQARLAMLRAGYRKEEIDQAKAILNEREVVLANARKVFQRQEELSTTQAISPQERDESEARFREAEARANSAREQLALIQSGYRPEEIAVADAEAKRAQANLSRAQLRLEDTFLRAPEPGVVLSRSQEPGAVVQPGTTVLALSLRDPVWVRTYLAEPDLGKVQPGDAVRVFTDSRPNQPYNGHVGYISPRAEFTPRNVETTELRTSLVYRTRMIVEDPNGELKQGMPVTVAIPLRGAVTNSPAVSANR